MMLITSCSDDDNAIVYQEQEYAGAYSLKDAQAYTASVTGELFSSEKIDTADFIPFINLCRYFNDTYLSYKNEAGETPFANIVSNITVMMGGDMSGLPGILDKFAAVSGKYVADTSTATWKRSSNYKNGIVLDFNDQYGVDVNVRLTWNPDSTDIIQLKDGLGNVIKDTIPSNLKLTIKGGNNEISYFSNIRCSVVGLRSLEFETNSYCHANDIVDSNNSYRIRTYSQVFDNSVKSVMTLCKNGYQLIDASKDVKGENFISSISDSEKYPQKLDESYMIMNIMDKLFLTKKEKSSLLQEKLNSIKNAGYKIHSEEFIKAYCNAVAETGETVVSNPVDNIFIFKVSSQPYYDTKNSIWVTMPYYTLNDNSTYSAVEFDTTGIVGSGITKIQELFSRLTELFNGAK